MCIYIFTLSSLSVAPLIVPSAQSVLLAQNPFSWLQENALNVGQVIIITTATDLNTVKYITVDVFTRDKNQGYSCMRFRCFVFVFLDRHAQGTSSDDVSNLWQWILPDPLGPWELWRLPWKPLLSCECLLAYIRVNCCQQIRQRALYCWKHVRCITNNLMGLLASHALDFNTFPFALCHFNTRGRYRHLFVLL